MSSLEVFCIVLEQAEDGTSNSFAKAKTTIIYRGVLFVLCLLVWYLLIKIWDLWQLGLAVGL